jgi:outer membrane lipoprotein-sorting protein
MFRLVPRLSLAAFIMPVSAVFLTFDSNADAGMPENVKNAKSVTFVQAHGVGHSNELRFTSYYRGHLMRMESKIGLTIIGDFKNKKLVQLSSSNKVAWKQVLNDKVARDFANPLPLIAKLSSKDIVVNGNEEKDGKTLVVCTVTGTAFMSQPGTDATEEFKVWVDQKTQLPTRIRVEVWKGGSSAVVEYRDFKWNVPLEDKLFDTTIPDDYRIVTKD